MSISTTPSESLDEQISSITDKTDTSVQWSVAQIQLLLDMPFNDLMFRAQSIHRQHHDANAVQLSTLISVKTGGCPEDCGVSRFDGRSWTNYTFDDGFFTGHIEAIAVSPDGALWFGAHGSRALGTVGGLTRFDGETWTQISNKGLKDSHINSIAIAPDGTVWCGTNNGIASYSAEEFDGR